MIKTLALCTLLVAGAGAAAAGDRPLTLAPFETVYQRVLAKPGASMTSSSGAVIPTQAFEPFYVYARTGSRLQIGRSPTRGPDGWIEASESVPWRQNIIASFTSPAGRQPQLFFDSPDTIMSLLDDPERTTRIEAMADGAPDPRGGQAIAVEPDVHVDISKRFYLLPILDFREDFHPITFDNVLLLNLASVPLETRAIERTLPMFDAGLVFVFDTTISMRPFVNAVTAGLDSIVGELEAAGMDDMVSMGAVGFRDDPALTPGLEYRVRTISTLDRDVPSALTVDRLKRADFASVSSEGVREDSLAGVLEALETTDWEQDGEPFGGRYVVLVTDAGPKIGTGDGALTPEVLSRLAEEKGVAILTLHLRNPEDNDADVREAAAAYRTLSRFEDRAFYYQVDASRPEVVGEEAERLARALISAMRKAEGARNTLPEVEVGDNELFLGYAMRTRWLGVAQGAQAPEVVEGWVSDKALEDGKTLAFQPRLVISRNELATMAELVAAFITAGERVTSTEQARAFFDDMQATVLRMAQNPERVINADAEGIGEVLEFLDGLPYKSQILGLDTQRWETSAIQRRQVLDSLRPRLMQYERWLRDPSVWSALHADATDGELVFAMPLEFLP